MTLPTDAQLDAVYDELNQLTDHQFALPVLPGQYLFAPDAGDAELWKLTAHGWFAADGTHYDSPLKRNPKLTQWQRVGLGAT